MNGSNAFASHVSAGSQDTLELLPSSPNPPSPSWGRASVTTHDAGQPHYFRRLPIIATCAASGVHSGLTVGAQSLLWAVLSLLWVVLAYIIAYSRTTVENCIYLYCECDFDGLDFSSISRTECEIDANRSFECENDTLSGGQSLSSP